MRKRARQRGGQLKFLACIAHKTLRFVSDAGQGRAPAHLMSIPHVIVVGAGSTGAATAHDLALRGLRVTVIERGEVASGTTGRATIACFMRAAVTV